MALVRMDVLALLGKSPPGSIVGRLDKDGRCKVPSVLHILDGFLLGGAAWVAW